MAVIAQAAHHLAEHVSVRGSAEFAIVFSLVWIAWVNGSLYVESHGRDDGRTRVIVFAQMGILALLAVFTADATDRSGRAFAVVYATFLAVVAWLFFSVRRQDRRTDRPEFVTDTGRYVTGMGVAVVVIVGSAFLPAGPRLIVWAVVAVAWVVGMFVAGRTTLRRGLPPTGSLVERFGLFTIIVLGEVVFGVVDGLSFAERNEKTITTGMIALWIGFGLWWIYFDLVGRRLPRNDSRAIANWLLTHLPFTMSIAAAGAAMVSLIEHAHDARTP
ncbi:MAG: low temperature requirement protein A, partial [Nocardioidaceae bacterium]